MRKTVTAAILMAVLVCASSATAETYRGVTIMPEHRCALYHPDDYPYPQSVEAQVVAALGGGIYGPYTGTYEGIPPIAGCGTGMEAGGCQ